MLCFVLINILNLSCAWIKYILCWTLLCSGPVQLGRAAERLVIITVVIVNKACHCVTQIPILHRPAPGSPAREGARGALLPIVMDTAATLLLHLMVWNVGHQLPQELVLVL